MASVPSHQSGPPNTRNLSNGPNGTGPQDRDRVVHGATYVMMVVTHRLSSFPSLLSHYDELPPHCGVIVDSRAQKLEALLDALTLTLTTLHPGFVALPAPFYGFPPRSKITILLAPLWLVHSFVGLPNQSPFSPFILAT